MKIVILVLCFIAVSPLDKAHASECSRSHLFAKRMIFKSAALAEASARKMTISRDPNGKNERDVADFTVDLFSYWFAFYQGVDRIETDTETVDSLRKSAKRVGVHKIARHVLSDLRNPVGDEDVMRNKLSILMLSIPEDIFLSDEKYELEVSRFLEWVEHEDATPEKASEQSRSIK